MHGLDDGVHAFGDANLVGRKLDIRKIREIYSEIVNLEGWLEAHTREKQEEGEQQHDQHVCVHDRC